MDDVKYKVDFYLGCKVEIEGGDEKANGLVQIKDLALGARLSAKIETTEEWKSQPAQIEIKRDSLISEVRKMIARSEDAM